MVENLSAQRMHGDERSRMPRIRFGIPYLTLRLGHSALTLDASWLVIVPASLWAVATIYVPILGAFLNGVDAWIVAASSILLCAASLFGHALVHVIVARASASDAPTSVPLFPLGDTAQVWSTGTSASREAWGAIAGPAANVLFAGLAYLLWNAQLHPYANISLPLVIVYNGALAAINLIPIYPLDGGRLLHAIGWGLLQRPSQATRWSFNLGLVFVALLSAWAIYLLFQPAHFSWQTGAITLVFAGLLLLGLLWRPIREGERERPEGGTGGRYSILGVAFASFLLFCLLSLTVSLIPMLGGIEIPGVALSVGPMVEMPAEYRHPFAGKFILTTVLLQTPITVGEWLFAQWSPLVKLVLPEQIVPPDTTAQEVARHQYKILEESETTAVVLGLRLAGYAASIKGNGVRVLSILPESPAQSILQPGDVITTLNGKQIRTTSELTNQLANQKPLSTIQLHIVRDIRPLDVAVPLMPPGKEGGPPRIGITIESAGFEATLPIPVKIVPQKIVGGPSAGLLFTLTVYDLLTPGDLTGGHVIAGTGTIDLDGTVGPIGGVAQKVAGAEFAGAEYFLSPPDNYAEALAAAQKIHVIKVATVEDAIQFLRSLPSAAGK